jgi:hypothetical protein
MRRFLVLALAMTMAGCAAMTVSSHIEASANFTEYLTYDWAAADNLPAGDPRLDNNPFFRDYVMGAIEKRLAAKGYERAVSGEPDLLVHYHASVNQKVDIQPAYRRHGECYGECEPSVVAYEHGTLVIDVIDRKTSRMVWRGWAQDDMDGVIDDQQRLKRKVDEEVAQVMLRLPRSGAHLR